MPSYDCSLTGTILVSWNKPRGIDQRAAGDPIFSWANWAVNWGVNVLYGRNAEYMPMLFSRGHSENAMVFTVADAIMQIVMPCALIPDDYARVYRNWLLQAKDDPWYERIAIVDRH